VHIINCSLIQSRIFCFFFSFSFCKYWLILFKESSLSIMVTRNPNWSIKILWYGIDYVKEKILSPIKRLTWDWLHCLFCLKLLRIICSPFSFSPFFYSSSHVPDSGVSEQFIQIFSSLALVNITQTQKNTIFQTLTSMNNFAKNWIWRRIFLCHFLFVYPLLLFVLFRWK